MAKLMSDSGFSAVALRTNGKSSPGTVEGWFAASAMQPPVGVPKILAAPKPLGSGEIKGEHFGSMRETVYIHPRVVVSRRNGLIERLGIADRLLGNLDPSNRVPLPDNDIKKWNDTRIQVTLPSDFRTNLLDSIKQRLARFDINDLKDSEIEFGYRVETGDEPSEWFYP